MTMMDLSDISHSSGGGCRRRSRTVKAISSSQLCGNKKESKKRVRFSYVANGPLSLGIHVFANEEFLSLDTKVRKQVWYSGLEIRAMKQANIDMVAKTREVANSNSNSNSNSKDNENEIESEQEWRGLEHIVEGETKRRQRIHHFVCAILKVQSERQRKGSKPDAIAEALGAFSRSQSRGDRRRAQKVGKLDYAEAHLYVHLQDQDGGDIIGNSNTNSSGFHNIQGGKKSRSFSIRSSSARGLLGQLGHRNRLPPDGVASSLAAVRRSRSGDHESLQKRRHLLRRVSHRAAALLPHKRHSINTVEASSSSRSLQSTESTLSATSSNTRANGNVSIVGRDRTVD